MLPYPYTLSHIAYAQGTLDDIIIGVGSVVAMLVPLVFAICVLIFIWGLALFILKSGDEKQHEAGKRRMVWGVLGLFAAATIWGIVGYISVLIGTTPGGQCNAPYIGAKTTTSCF